MFYITNQTNKIIATDTEFLNALNVTTLDDLTKKIILMEIQIHQTTTNCIEILLDNHTVCFHINTIPLSSFLGELTLTQLSRKENDSIEKVIQEKNISLSNDFILPMDDTEEISKIEESPSHEPIMIDIKTRSKEIGISETDYDAFLNEYIDTAISLESDLQSKDKDIYLAATGTLEQLAEVLQLPYVNEVLKSYNYDTPEVAIIESFYDILSRLTVDRNSGSNTVLEKDLGLKDIKAKDVNFSIHEIAMSLSLPIKLVEEFLYDFIKQSSNETEKMISAYEKDDLKSLQKTAKLLEVASSNLHIHTLANVLNQIQLTDEFSKIKIHLQDYWAYFLSIESQMKTYTQQKDV